MVVKLPAIPGARGETLLANVYFPVGSETAERAQVLSLLSSIANYAVKHKANIIAAGDWNAVTPAIHGAGTRSLPPDKTPIWLHGSTPRWVSLARNATLPSKDSHTSTI